jgi:hypothetical protein
MDIVTMLRDLWRLRLCVAVVCMIAVLAGMLVLYKPSIPPKPRRHDIGVATAQILVDTPQSQVVQVSPAGSALLAEQANVLATLMVDGTIKADIAQRAGIPADEFAGVTTAAVDQSSSGPLAVSVPSAPHPYVLTTQLLTNNSGQSLPIIALNAQAPDSAAAANLADAAVAGLRAYLSSKAALARIPDAERLQLIGLGAPQVATETRGPSSAIAIVVVIAVLLLGCAGILAALALVRGWRAASAREKLDDAEKLADGDLIEWDVRAADEELPYGLDESPVPLRPEVVPALRIGDRATSTGQLRS